MKLKNCRHIKLKSNDDGLKIPISDFAKAKFELYNSVYYLLKQFKQNCKSEDNIELINRVFDSFYKSDVCFFNNIYNFDPSFGCNSLLPSDSLRYFSSIKLFHYTSMEAFTSIAKSNSILLSNVQDLNDFLECKLYFKMVLNDAIKNKTIKEETARTVLDVFYEKLATIFIFSFTTEDDDAAQWDRYANEGEGICLVTSYSRIISWMRLNGIKYPLLSPVEYIDKNEKLSFISNYRLYNYRDYFELLCDLKEGPYAKLGNTGFDLFIADCCKIKERSFRNEKEFRMIVFNASFENRTISFPKNTANAIQHVANKKLKFDNVFFKSKDNQDKINRSLFTDVIIGPKSKKVPNDVREFLISNGYMDVTVSKSNSSLR